MIDKIRELPPPTLRIRVTWGSIAYVIFVLILFVLPPLLTSKSVSRIVGALLILGACGLWFSGSRRTRRLKRRGKWPPPHNPKPRFASLVQTLNRTVTLPWHIPMSRPDEAYLTTPGLFRARAG